MALFKNSFLTVFIGFLTLVAVQCSPKQPRRVDPMVVECIKKMQQYCDKIIGDIEWCAMKSINYYPWAKFLDTRECAQALVHNWQKNKPIIGLEHGTIPKYMQEYHATLLKFIAPGNLLTPGQYCVQTVGIDKNDEDKLQKCLKDLEKFGEYPKEIINYAINRTSLFNKKYKADNFAIDYLKHIGNELVVKRKIKNPIRYCKSYFKA